MGWIALKWLRPDRAAWWRRLGATRHHLACVVLHEAIRQESLIGVPVATYKVDELIELVGGSRSTVARTLTNLIDLGFCRVNSRQGRGSQLLIGVRDPDQSGGDFSGDFRGDFSGADSGVESNTSGAGRINDGHFPGDFDGDFPASGDRDQDQRSDLGSDPRSDLSGRSPTPVDLTTLSELIPDPNRLTLTATGEVRQPAPVKRPKLDVSRIPPRAWAAADYLRSMLIAQNPSCWVSRQKWVPGTKENPAGGVRDGQRAKWADEFRLINERDRKDWEEIAKTCHWLFNQPPGPRFIVDSPGSLRKKWDNIEQVRRNQALQKQQPSNRYTDNRPAPETRRWGSDGWSEAPPEGDKT